MLLITRPTVTPVQAMSQKFAGVSAMSARTSWMSRICGKSSADCLEAEGGFWGRQRCKMMKAGLLVDACKSSASIAAPFPLNPSSYGKNL